MYRFGEIKKSFIDYNLPKALLKPAPVGHLGDLRRGVEKGERR